MKAKLFIMISLLSWAFIASADDDKSVKHTEKVKIIFSDDGENATKKIFVNGKELTPEEAEEFEASKKMKTIHMKHGDALKSAHKVMMIKSDGSDDGDMEKHVKIIKKHSGDMDDEDVQVFLDKVGDITTEKIIVNGKELSAEEIEEYKASGKMKVINIDADLVKGKGHKMMFINSDSDHGEDIDIEVNMDKIDGLHEIDESMVQEWISEDGKNIKIIKSGIVSIDDDSASLGFMANVEDDGWHLTKVMDKSGAKDAGIMVGDIVTKIGTADLTRSPDSERLEVNKLPKFEDKEMVKVMLQRDGQPITFDVQARKLDKSEMILDLQVDAHDNFKWIEKLHEDGDIASNIKVMVFDGKDGNFRLNEDDIHMVFPEKLGKMNFFVSDGHSTSKLLGKNHEMSAMSKGLSKYFNTTGGVLVLHVDESNAFNLTDGDVIKAINGNKVETPKDVIKQLINADDQENIKMKVVRNKKNKTLKYKK